jgi:hypothetical protein
MLSAFQHNFPVKLLQQRSVRCRCWLSNPDYIICHNRAIHFLPLHRSCSWRSATAKRVGLCLWGGEKGAEHPRFNAACCAFPGWDAGVQEGHCKTHRPSPFWIPVQALWRKGLPGAVPHHATDEGGQGAFALPEMRMEIRLDVI